MIAGPTKSAGTTPSSSSQVPAPPEAEHPQFPPDPIPTIIPGASVNLLAGAPGAGKTALSSWIMCQFRDNLPIFGHQPTPIPKLGIICADRSWAQSTSKWFALAGYGDIPHYSLLDDDEFSVRRLRQKQERVTILEACLDKLFLPWGSLVLVDPLALFLGGNLLDYDTCLVACAEIRGACRRRGITIIGTAHASKQRADKNQRYLRLQDRIAGSVALFGYTDTQMYLASPAEIEEEFSVFHWSPHHAVSQDFKLTRADNGLFIPYEGKEGDLVWEARTLLTIIAESPTLTKLTDIVPIAEVQFGWSRSKVYRYVGDLVQAHLLIRVGRTHVCRPKPSA